MTIFLNMVLNKEGAYYPSIFLKLENDSEITLSYVQYIHISSSSVTASRVNSDLNILESKTYTNVRWVQVLD